MNEPEEGFAVVPEPKKYKCKAHGDVSGETMEITLPDGISTTFCIRCCMQFLTSTIGVVEEVEEVEKEKE